MPMEGWVKFLSPQNPLGVSGVNSVAAESNAIAVNGDQFFKHEKTTEKNSILLLWCHPSVSKPSHSNPTQNHLWYTLLDVWIMLNYAKLSKLS